MEFPTNPTRRELREQQRIATVIAGLDLPPVEPVPEVEPGFNFETFVEYVKDA